MKISRTLILAAALILGASIGLGSVQTYFKTKSTVESSSLGEAPLQVIPVSSVGDDSVPERRLYYVSPDAAAVKNGNLTFPDGSSVPVVLATYTPPLSSVDLGDKTIDVYDDLVVSANEGEAASARTLYQVLKHCKDAFRDSESLAEAIRQIEIENVLTHPHGSAPDEPLPSGMDSTHMIEGLRAANKKCEGITDDHLSDIASWAKLAAEGGDFVGMRLWVRELGKNYASFEVWQNAWADGGHDSALQEIAILYRDGVPDSPISEPDYVSAYAYQLAYFKLIEFAYASRNANMMGGIDGALNSLGGYLTPKQQSEAVEMAADIVRSNPTCCQTAFIAPKL